MNFAVYVIKPVLIVAGKAINNDGDREGENKDAGEGAEPANQFPKQGLRVEVIADGGEGHQAPPKGLHEGPRIAGVFGKMSIEKSSQLTDISFSGETPPPPPPPLSIFGKKEK